MVSVLKEMGISPIGVFMFPCPEFVQLHGEGTQECLEVGLLATKPVASINIGGDSILSLGHSRVVFFFSSHVSLG